MIYIQSDKDKKLPHHFDCACALYGAIDLAMDFRLTSFEEVQSGKFDQVIKTNLFVGSVEFMREVFKRIGKDDVRLPYNSDREHEIITLANAKERALFGEKIFIKPKEIKLFTGFVLDQSFYTCLNGIPDDTLVLAYKPFSSEIKSEWRLYVHNNKIADAKNYSGDFATAPYIGFYANLLTIKKSQGRLPEIFKQMPCAYTIDIAMMYDGASEIVEFNDMWAIGNYGVSNDLYTRMLMDRYFEIVKS